MCPVLPCAPSWQGCEWQKHLATHVLGERSCIHRMTHHGEFAGAMELPQLQLMSLGLPALEWLPGAQTPLCQCLTPRLNLHCCIPGVATAKRQPKPRCISTPVFTLQLHRMQRHQLLATWGQLLGSCSPCCG